MQTHLNAHQLVLRRDSATGFVKVGWAAELPIGRFIHIALIGETPDCGPIYQNSPLFEEFLQACQRAKDLNRPLSAAQKHDLQDRGCIPVPLDLNDSAAVTAPDAFGSFHEAAMGALFRLTGNISSVWAVVYENTITQLHPCHPQKTMEELEFQVWKHYILNRLTRYPGEITMGKLVVQESGLWFCPQQ
jgi:hypothetical protein